jgi:hypothetical protein
MARAKVALNPTQLQRMYLMDGMSARVIATKLGTTPRTVLARLRDMGIEVRPPVARRSELTPEVRFAGVQRLADAQAQVEAAEARVRATVIELRTEGLTWSDISAGLGMPESTAHDRFFDL